MSYQILNNYFILSYLVLSCSLLSEYQTHYKDIHWNLYQNVSICLEFGNAFRPSVARGGLFFSSNYPHYILTSITFIFHTKKYLKFNIFFHFSQIQYFLSFHPNSILSFIMNSNTTPTLSTTSSSSIDIDEEIE